MAKAQWLLAKREVDYPDRGLLDREITVFDSYDDHLREVKRQWQLWDDAGITSLIDAFDLQHTWKYIHAKTASEAIDVLNRTPLLAHGENPRSVYFNDMKDGYVQQTKLRELDPNKMDVLLSVIDDDEHPIPSWRANIPNPPDKNPNQEKLWRVAFPISVWYVRPVLSEK